MIISTSSDENYIGYVECLAKSLIKTNPDIKFHVRLVSIGDKLNIENKLRLIKPDILIQFDDVKLSTANRSMGRHGSFLWHGVMDGITVEPKIPNVKHSKWLISDRQCYTSNIRFRNIYDLLNDGHDSVLYLDADSIIMRNLSPLFNKIHQHDISIKLTIAPSNSPIPYPNNRCWECSCIGVNNTKIARSFIEDVMVNTEKDMFFWDADQFEFDNSVTRFSSDINLNIMTESDESFGDCSGNNLDPSAYIWAGSYKNKIEDGDFTRELKRYVSYN